MKQTSDDHLIPARAWRNQFAPKKILAIRLQATGDSVITLPYLNDLKTQLPATQLDFLTREECESIPRNIALFDKVYSIRGGRDHRRQLLYALALLPELLLKRYDVVIDLQNNFISRFIRKSLGPKAWSSFDRFSSQSAGERTRQTIEATRLCKIKPNTGFATGKNLNADFILETNGWTKNNLIVLNPAAAFPSRNWPIENYLLFAKQWLLHSPQTQFLMLGTSFIEEKAAYLQSQLPGHFINLVGKTTPAEAFAILRKASLVLSEDSGLMHMAWVSGIPTIALFGGTRSDWARPLGECSFFLDSSDMACGNCMLETCKFGDTRCLTRYTPEMIVQYSIQLLNKRSHLIPE